MAAGVRFGRRLAATLRVELEGSNVSCSCMLARAATSMNSANLAATSMNSANLAGLAQIGRALRYIFAGGK